MRSRFVFRSSMTIVLVLAMAKVGVSQENTSPATQHDSKSDDAEHAPDRQNSLGWPFIKHLGQDQKEFWVDGATKWNRKKAQHFLPFVAFTGGLIAGDSWISNQIPLREVHRSRQISDFAVYTMIGASAGGFLLGELHNSDHARETALLAAEATIDSTAVNYVFKGISERERPYQDNGHGYFFVGGTSFPSEHSAVAWSIASVAAHEYPGPLMKVLAYGLAGTITITRVTAQQHFSSDVVVGSALGWYMGRQVYRAHHDPDLGGGPWGSSSFFSSEHETERPAIERMSSPPLPLDSWIYPALRRLAALGYIDTTYLGQRPWTRLQCAEMLQEVADRLGLDEVSDTDDEATRIYRSIAAELSPEIKRLNGDVNTDAAVDSVYTTLTGISGPPLRDSYHFGQTIADDFGRPYAEGFNSYDGFTSHAEAGPVSLSVQGEFQHAPATASYPLSTLQAIDAVDFTGPQNNATTTINRFRLLTSVAALTWRNIQFSFGNQSLWLGPGESGALLMSDNAEPFPMFRFQSVAPYRIPILSSILGPVQTEFFLGQLSGHHWEVNSPNIVGPVISPQPFIHGEKISFKPMANLEIGMGVTAMFAGPGLPFTWANFLRTYFVHSPNPATNPGKRTSEFDISYRIRKFATLYADTMVVDEVSPLGSTRPTVSPGIYFPRLPKLHRFELRAEGIKEPVTSEFQPGFVYYDARRFLNGYTNNGLLMGSWIGRAGRGGQGWLTYSLSPQTHFQLGYRHQEVSKDFIGGGRLIDYRASGEARLKHNFAVSALVQYEQWRFPVIAPDRKSNVTASVTFTYYPQHHSQANPPTP